MPKKHYKRGGGIFDNLGASLSNGWNSVSQTASSGLATVKESTANAWDKTKKATSSTYNSVTGTSTTPSSAPVATVGGKSRKHKKGGYKNNISHNNLASSASPFSGKTAQPQTWVGGKTKRRRHRHSKSCRHKKHRKH